MARDKPPEWPAFQSNEEWASQYKTEDQVRAGIQSCRMWIKAVESRTNPEERGKGRAHWENRLRLLRTKALLMGIQLED